MCIVLIHVYDSQHTRSFHFPVHFFYEYGDFTLTNEIDILNASALLDFVNVNHSLFAFVVIWGKICESS